MNTPQVIRQPGGAWERLADGRKGRQLWRNQAGRRTLTAFGRTRLAGWQDLTVHVPVFEYEYANELRGYNPNAKAVWYPISEQTMPGMLAELQENVPMNMMDSLENLQELPPGFKRWVLEQLTGEDGQLIDEGSDRGWWLNPAGQWFMSVQHVEMRGGRLSLVTDLADRPMRANALLFDCVPFNWHLSKAALAEKDCVPVCLAEALGQTQDFCKKGLMRAAQALGQEENGFTRAAVFHFLQEESDRTSVQIGWKALENGKVVAHQKADHGAPFVGFSQWAGHMYLYSRDTPALNSAPQHTSRQMRVGIRQYSRALQSIPQEMRTRFIPNSVVGLALWELKKQKKTRKHDAPEMEKWDGTIKPGWFWTHSVEDAQLEMLGQGYSPTVTMTGLHKKSGLRLRLSKAESCIVRERPEEFEDLQEFAAHIGLPWKGSGMASFAFNAICDLLRRKRGVTTIEHGMCHLCGAPSQEIDHDPQLARSTEETEEKPICKICHLEKTAADASFDSGWFPLTSVLNLQTTEFFHLAEKDKPFNLIAAKGHQVGAFEIDFIRAYRHALEFPMDTWSVFSPTDSFTAPGNELAPWSFVDAGPATSENSELRENGYHGPQWMCRPLLQYCLDCNFVQPAHIQASFWPTRSLPADTFQQPLARFDEATQKLVDACPSWSRPEKRTFCKSLVNKAIGFMQSVDEPMKFFHTCSSDPKDRPPNSTKLPCVKEGFHEWVQHVECRSTESLRPIHAMVMQISRLRMHLLARHIRTSIHGWRPQWLVQAKTDAWRLSCPKSKMPEVKKLQSLTYRAFGADCDGKALRVCEKEDRMQNCSDVRMNGVRPEIVKHVRHESWEGLLDKSFGIFGCGGGGKNTNMRQIVTRLKK